MTAAVSGPNPSAGVRSESPAGEASWKTALVVALLAVVAIRLHELVPALANFRPALVFGVGGFAILWSSARRSERRAVVREPSMRWVLAYALWAAVTVPFALWRGLAIDSLLDFPPSIVIVAALLLLVPAERSLRLVLTGYVLAAGVYGVALLRIGEAIGEERTQLGQTLDANDLALVLASTLPLALGLGLRVGGWRRLVFALTAVIFLVATTATGSRGGTLALLVGSLVFVCGQRGSRKFVFLGALVIAGIIAWSEAPPTYRERMAALVAGQKDYNYTDYVGRTQVWARAGGYIVQHPVVGVGLGNFPVAEGGHLASWGAKGKWSAAHNAYLQAFAELGIPGGLIFLGLLAHTIRRAARYWPPRSGTTGPPVLHRPELLASIVAFAVGSFFLSTAYFYSLFALVGLIALTDRQARQTAQGVEASAPPPSPARSRVGEKGPVRRGVLLPNTRASAS